jgi:hypothetical protein
MEHTLQIKMYGGSKYLELRGSESLFVGEMAFQITK